jgi:diguanylate cyclase
MMQLLLIDDDTVDRLTIRRALRQSGREIEVQEAYSAEEGLEWVKRKQFDLVLLDYQLPSMSGLELLKLLKSSTEHRTAVVMLSHNEDEELAIDCIEAGAQDFIVKSEISVFRLTRAMLHAKERFRIEEQLSETLEKLRNLAQLDSLTGLANRYMFDSGLSQGLSLARRQANVLSLIMLDLDKFKEVNDTLGHAAGDRLLQEVAQRLNTVIREGDLLCRLGGDEFAIIVNNLDNLMQVDNLTGRIFKVLAEPVKIAGTELMISASIGIASYPECGDSAEDLLRCADVAMYRSKAAGKNQAHFYSRAFHEIVQRQIELKRDMDRALERNEFELRFQPQFCPQKEVLQGVEILVFWRHSSGLLPADEFMPHADSDALVEAIGAFVMRAACKQLRLWQRHYSIDGLKMTIAINLPNYQMNSLKVVSFVESLLQKYHLSASCLELELTEASLRGVETLATLTALSRLGVDLILNNFGSGLSSLLRLQQYPFTILKIDKFFMQSILVDEKEALLLKGINAFAKTLALKVIAEGICTQAQKEYCQQLGLDRLQGPLFGEPMTANEFETQFLSSV